MSELGTLKIAGSGSSGGGEFSDVRISGVGKITGDVKCESMHISGAGKIKGNVDCKNDIHISGTLSAIDIKAKELHISGACSAAGKIEADEIRVSGGLNAEGDICGESVKVSGNITTKHLLSAETIEIKFDSSNCSIGEIGGGVITIRPRNSQNRQMEGRAVVDIIKESLTNFVQCGKKAATIKIGSIEGDDITIENCIADTIRGTNVTVMSGCEVKKIEYTGNLTVEDGAKVEEQIKI